VQDWRFISNQETCIQETLEELASMGMGEGGEGSWGGGRVEAVAGVWW